MLLRKRTWGILALSCFGIVPSARAALEVSLHEVNTSVGLKPINATNEWKLETDPVVIGAPAVDDTLGGSLNNTYDPTQFSLATDPETGSYALGYSVQAIDPFIVTSFIVEDTQGSYAVSENLTTDVQTVTPSVDPAPNNVEAGIVEDITFELNLSEENEALPATMDQNFFQLNLIPLENIPNIVGTNYSTYGADGSYLLIGDPGDVPDGTKLTFPNTTFDTSYVPEPTIVGLLGIGLLGLSARRHRR
jgi:hypothetical protein